MPELKRTFSGGIMNKDLDERLVPNGQYRDALNVQVSTSEGSDVGALQNILGNKIPYSSALNTTQLGINPFVVGSIRKDDTECIYWFVASNSKSLILEYNQTTNVVSPILVDTQNILRFNRSNLITGVEILDDFLIWTDNQTEPKMIKISTWKGYANNSYNHTQALGADFIEDQITVIKKGPKKPPKLKMARSFRTGIIETVLTQKSFSVQDQNTNEYDPMPTGLYTDQNGDGSVDTASGIVSFQTAANFKVGDKLRLVKSDLFDNDLSYKCSGTPADCVKIAKHHLLKERKIDLIVSGINHCSNSSISVLYSGTMSAAIEGAIENTPSIGFSLCDYDPNASLSHTGRGGRDIVVSR